MGDQKDYTAINEGNYYTVGEDRNPLTNKRYECEKCGHDTIRRGLKTCPECGRKIIWVRKEN